MTGLGRSISHCQPRFESSKERASAACPWVRSLEWPETSASSSAPVARRESTSSRPIDSHDLADHFYTRASKRNWQRRACVPVWTWIFMVKPMQLVCWELRSSNWIFNKLVGTIGDEINFLRKWIYIYVCAFPRSLNCTMQLLSSAKNILLSCVSSTFQCRYFSKLKSLIGPIFFVLIIDSFDVWIFPIFRVTLETFLAFVLFLFCNRK